MVLLRSRVLALTLALATAAVLPGLASAQSVEEARERRQDVQARLDQAAEQLASIETRVAELEDERDRLAREVQHLTDRAEAASERISRRVRQAYIHGPMDPVTLVLAGGDLDDVVDRAQVIDRLTFSDEVAYEQAVASRARLTELRGQLADAESALDAEMERQEQLVEELRDDLEEARALEERLVEEERRREEAERRRREAEQRRRRAARAAQAAQSAQSAPAAASAPAPGGSACPVARPRSFTDTWGAPRSGGRSHRGTDILAPFGTPVIAIVSGTWDVMRPGRSAGNWAILRGSDGNHYWYLHLQSHTVGDGAQVSAGQQVATNGDTGNARGGPPHVHFELHPGGGGAINPYPMLRRVCG